MLAKEVVRGGKYLSSMPYSEIESFKASTVSSFSWILIGAVKKETTNYMISNI
jgi:hypothetical protein